MLEKKITRDINRLPWLVQRAITQPEHCALRFHNGELSFSDLLQGAQLAADKLSALGLGKGDVLALALSNIPLFVELLHACSLIGAIFLPLNIRLSADELRYPLEETSAKICICEEGELASLLKNESLFSNAGFRLISTEEFKQIERGEKRICTDNIQFDAASPLCIMYTSGTTGRPKGVLLSYGNFEASARATQVHFSLTAADCWLACLPLYHIGGLSILCRSVILGLSVFLQKRFDPQQALLAMDSSVSMVSFVPNMLQRVIKIIDSERSFPRLKAVILGGENLPESLQKKAKSYGLPVVASYGLTESCSQIAASLQGDSLQTLRMFQGIDLKIIDDQRATQTFGQEGEILIRGDCVSSHYFLAREQVIQDAWLHTGDIGRLEHDGSLTVLNRRRDLIISGGENIYPSEVERVLLQHPAVNDALVFGENDSQYGQRVAARVVVKDSALPEAEKIREFCRSYLAAYKVPTRIETVSRLERASSGKLIRD